MHVAPQIVVNCCLLARGGEGGRPNTYIESEPLLWESSEGLLKITNCQCSPFNSGLCFFMSPQRTWVRAGKVTFARVHLAFHHCAFSYVFSKRLPEKMQSHIDCICLIFLHCAFSYVSSKCLPQKMHSHIGCIWMTFLYCGFSNVSSNCLPQMMHNHTDCICLTFRRCVF